MMDGWIKKGIEAECQKLPLNREAKTKKTTDPDPQEGLI